MSTLPEEMRRNAYKKVKPKITARAAHVLSVLGDNALTVSEIVNRMYRAKEIPNKNRNYVAPRITELDKAGIIEAVGKRKSRLSNRPETVYQKKSD